MCGITGFVSRKYQQADLQCMTDTLAHRGPDADGFYFNAGTGIGLGHRRLSIIDLSAAANQPFYSACGRYIMVYNGEVYNFRELTVKYGINPRTHGDSEIILEAFAKAGPECFNDLNGMFALAIWDTQTEKLFVARDRAGVKPLYYWYSEGDFAFASELKAILKLPVPRAVNHQSVAHFLNLGYIPEEFTVYEDCYKLQPGQYAVLYKGVLDIFSYWSLEDEIDPATLRDETQAKNTLRSLLESSVEYCMISDVPLGVFLSGGVDSSTVAAIARKVSGGPVKTFSIGFNEEKYNETRFARQVAKHIGSEHYEFTVTEQDALHLVDSLIDIYDEPYADTSAIPTLMVSKLAREHVTVALSGDGGDELFMGYGFYIWARRFQNPVFKAFRKPLAGALYATGNSRLQRGSKLLNYQNRERIRSHIFSQEQYFFSEDEISELLVAPQPLSFTETIAHPKRKLTAREEQSFFDIKNYLPEELLVKTDRASMHHSLEVRVPLLDHRLIEFAINLDEKLKTRNKTPKYLLKQVLYEYVPAEIFNRPKWGFAVPMMYWMKNELSYLIEKYLSESWVREVNLVHWDQVAALIRQFRGGRDYLYNRVWALVILHKWYKEKMV